MSSASADHVDIEVVLALRTISKQQLMAAMKRDKDVRALSSVKRIQQHIYSMRRKQNY